MRSKDQHVRAQIDAAKSFLISEGLEDVEDHAVLQSKQFDGFHTIRSTFNGKAHLLRLAFGWLEEHTPASVADFLRTNGIADMLKDADQVEVRITDSGQIGGQTEYPF